MECSMWQCWHEDSPAGCMTDSLLLKAPGAPGKGLTVDN
jgi:hypothetical protein